MQRLIALLLLALGFGSSAVHAQVALPAGAEACTSGQVAGYACDSVALLAQRGPAELGRAPGFNDLWGWTDTQTGREIALVGTYTGVLFVDVTDPVQPVYLGRLPTTTVSSAWRDIKVYRDHAFVVADASGAHGMQVFDLRQLRPVTGGAPVTFEPTARYDGIGSAHNLVVNEETGFAYAVGSSGGAQACGPGLHMVDIRTPAEPQFAGCFNSSVGRGYTHDAQCVVYQGPDADYRGREICFNADEAGIAVADVTDKRRPVEISTATYPTVAYAHQGWLSDDHRYYYQNDEGDEGSFGLPTTTYIWDLADLDAPLLAATHEAATRTTDHNLYTLGDYLYQANYGSGFRLLDISERLAPREIGFLDTTPASGSGAWSVYPYFASGTVLVSDINAGLFVLQPMMPLAPAPRTDYVSAAVGEQLRIQVLANDLDPNGDALTVALETPPSAGTATVNADGTITYRPAPNAAGETRFAYRVTDPSGLSRTAGVVVSSLSTDAADARVQILHNVADPAAALVDVYVDGERVADDLAFGSGTAVLDVPAGTREIGVAPATSTSAAETVVRLPVTLDEATTYALVLNGVLDPGAFDANPQGRDTALRVDVRPDARLQAPNPSSVDLFVAHGVTDASELTVSVQGPGGPERVLAADLGFGEVSDYATLGAEAYKLTIRTRDLAYSYELDLRDRGGEALALLLSGFLAPGRPALTPVAVLPSGAPAATILTDTEESPEQPGALVLEAAYPNPFREATTLAVTLAAPGPVTVAAYDVLGRQVAVLHDGLLPAGTHRLRFDAGGLPSGTYFVRAQMGARSQAHLVTVLR